MYWTILVKMKNLVKKIPLWLWIALGVCLILFFLYQYAYNKGQADVQAKWDKSIERGKTIVEGLKKQQVIINTVVETKYIDRVKTVKIKGDTIEKQIPIYITEPNMLLPSGFRLLHDAAASNSIPDSSRLPYESPTSIGDATTTIVRNYTTFWEMRETILAWQDWYQQHRKAYLELCKQPGVLCSKDKE